MPPPSTSATHSAELGWTGRRLTSWFHGLSAGKTRHGADGADGADGGTVGAGRGGGAAVVVGPTVAIDPIVVVLVLVVVVVVLVGDDVVGVRASGSSVSSPPTGRR